MLKVSAYNVSQKYHVRLHKKNKPKYADISQVNPKSVFKRW